MGRELILLTGATGFVGFRVLVRALECGYAVRCAVQGPGDLKKILSAPSIKALKVSDHQLFWALLYDMTVPGAFDEAIRGANYIIHCAAAPANSLASDTIEQDQDGEIDHLAALGVLNLLQGAARMKPNNLKRIVITTSLADMDFNGRVTGGGPLVAAPLVSDDGIRASAHAAPFRDGSKLSSAGTASTLRVSEEWTLTQTPPFDVVFVLPDNILGRHELATSLREAEVGSNGVIIQALEGVVAGSHLPLNGGFVSVHDVANAQISALTADVSRNGVIVLSTSITKRDVLEIVQRRSPGVFPEGTHHAGYQLSAKSYSSGVTEEAERIGTGYRSFESTVLEVAGQYVDLKQE